MKTFNKPIRIILIFVALLFADNFINNSVYATGISIDAGLTPAEGR